MADLNGRLTRLEAQLPNHGSLLGDLDRWQRHYGRALAALVVGLPERYREALVDELDADLHGISPLGKHLASLAASAAWSRHDPAPPYPSRSPLVVPETVCDLLTGDDADDAVFNGLECATCGLAAPYSRRALAAAVPWPVAPLAVAYFASCPHCGGELVWSRE